MKTRYFTTWTLAALMILGLIAGCGGGGSSEGSVEYSGVTDPAQIDEFNAEEILVDLYTGGLSAEGLGSIGFGAVAGEGTGAALPWKVNGILQDAASALTASLDDGPVYAGAPLSMPPLSGCTGQMTASGSGPEQGQAGNFTVTRTFSNSRPWNELETACDEGVGTMSGRVRVTGYMDWTDPENPVIGGTLTMTFPSLTYTFGTSSISMGGSWVIDLDTMSFSFSYVVRDNSTGVTYRFDQCTLSVSGDSIDMSGTVYHPVHGWVDFSITMTVGLDDIPSSGTIQIWDDYLDDALLEMLTPPDYRITVTIIGDPGSPYEIYGSWAL